MAKSSKNSVFLPFPDRRLNPNNRGYRSEAHLRGVKEKAKYDAYMLSKHLKGLQVNNGVRITYFTPDDRRRDLDNLLAASKQALDGVAAAMEVDDCTFRPLIIDKRKAVRADGVGMLVEIL